MKGRLIAVLAALALIAGLGTTVSACSSTPPVPPIPASWYVSYMGTNYCPYQYDVHETQMYGTVGTCTPMLVPSMVPMAGTPQYAVVSYWTTYSDFYESDYWYYHYYAPMGSRFHVTIIPYSGYMSNVSSFQRTYHAQIVTNTRNAKWSGGSGKGGSKSGSYQFPTTNSKDANRIMSNANSGGSNTGTSNSRGGSGTISNKGSTGSSGSRSGSGSTGKSGRR